MRKGRARPWPASSTAAGGHALRLAGVANMGEDRRLVRLDLLSGQLVCFGRLAGTDTSARDVAGNGLRMTFGADPAFVNPVVT